MPATSPAQYYITQSIMTASPGQLVLMLYDGALRFMAQARAGFALPTESYQRIETVNTGILRAEAVLRELRDNLDLTNGGEVAENLDKLYDYYLRRLLEANLRKDETALVEIEGLVRELREGWAEMLQQQEAVA
jgi:flagellar secretion chaperone FliS